jgi:hypothetical protein
MATTNQTQIGEIMLGSIYRVLFTCVMLTCIMGTIVAAITPTTINKSYLKRTGYLLALPC